MDVLMLNRSPAVKEEKEAEHVHGAEDGGDAAVEHEGASARHNEQSPSSSPPERKYASVSKQDEHLESTRAEMGEVKQENERLKATLARIMKDYQSLQTLFFDVLQQDHEMIKPMEENSDTHHEEANEAEFVSLSLGTSSGGHNKEEKKAPSSKAKEDEQMEEALSLGLGCKFDGSCSVPSNASRKSSFEEQKEEEAAEACPPSKIVKTLRSGDVDASEETPVKRARVSVRVRCDAPVMNDGCQWRKYGQKVAKGNPCPRAYYRCTVAPSCPVRKQVQRCAENMSILITTYEGTHNHPLPASATAMASTTAAAASILTSGSSASQPATGGMTMAIPSRCVGLGGVSTNHISSPHGLSFSLSDISRQRQLYPPNIKPSIISPSPSCPTITLDLTAPSSSSPSPQITRLSSSLNSTTSYSQTGLTLSSSSEYSTIPTSWSSTGYLSYLAHPHNIKSKLGFSNLDRTPEEPFHSPFLPTAGGSAPPVDTLPSLTDTIAAATKAITSDPSFQSALAAAITSIVGGAGNQGSMAAAAEAARGRNRWLEQLLPASPFTSSPNGNACASSYLTRSTSSTANVHPADLMLLQPPLASSSSKNASASPVKTRERSS